MIRFIDLTNQIMIPAGDDDIYHEFAFFNTVNDRFMEFCGEQTWHTPKDFIDDFALEEDNPYTDEPMRFIGKIPVDFYFPEGSEDG
jgi:hypothetical protein